MHRRSTSTGRVTTAADQNSETRLLEYRRVVVIRVSHCPAARVFCRLAACPVRPHTVAVRQHLERVVFIRLQLKYNVMCVHNACK